MTVYETEAKAFKAGLQYKPDCRFRVLATDGGYKVLMIPRAGLPFYL